MVIQIKKLSSILLIAGLMLSLSSCFFTRTTSSTPQKSSIFKTKSKKKKAHPHGGPPGQTKKGKGYPGKRI